MKAIDWLHAPISCPVADSGISGVEPSGSATRVS
jgi:hypothetical protein